MWDERKAKCYNYALGDRECDIEFVEGDEEHKGGAGVKGFADRNADLIGNRVITRTVHQRRLGDVLKELGIREVDFISMDVEGYEMNILKGIDFDAVDIKCLLMENNKNGGNMPDLNLREFCKQKGYTFIGRIVCDDIFVKL